MMPDSALAPKNSLCVWTSGPLSDVPNCGGGGRGGGVHRQEEKSITNLLTCSPWLNNAGLVTVRIRTKAGAQHELPTIPIARRKSYATNTCLAQWAACIVHIVSFPPPGKRSGGF